MIASLKCAKIEVSAGVLLEMIEFIRRTLSDPALFWPALEAIATIIGATFIWWQLRRIKQESAAHRVESVKYVTTDHLGTEKFEELHASLKNARGSDQQDLGAGIQDAAFELLAIVDVVRVLIDQGYVDKKLLLELMGETLHEVSDYMTNFVAMERFRDAAKIPKIYPETWRLLKEAKKTRAKKLRRVSARFK